MISHALLKQQSDDLKIKTQNKLVELGQVAGYFLSLCPINLFRTGSGSAEHVCALLSNLRCCEEKPEEQKKKCIRTLI